MSVCNLTTILKLIKSIRLEKLLSITILLFGLIGLIISLLVSTETLNYLSESTYKLSCNINTVLNCQEVILSKESKIFGIPNSFLGLIGYSFIIPYALNLVLGHKNHKIVDLIYLLGTSVAFIFSYWLMYISAFIIGYFCIYCMISCISITNIFFSNISLNIKNYLNNTNIFHIFIKKGLIFYVISFFYVLIFLMVYTKLT